MALVGDIDRGGVIAQLVGTWSLLSDAERALTAGFIVNKFRGDVSLFDDGLAVIAARTGMASFGVAPWFADAGRLPREDAFDVTAGSAAGPGRAGTMTAGPIKIAVPVFSRIANFDDLDPLRAEPDVSVVMVPAGAALPGDADLVVLPGSKATLADLAHLRAQGWDIDIAAHVRRGGAVLGLCGGYQMLGRRIADPQGIEGAPSAADGLGLLDVETELAVAKRLVETAGAHVATGCAVSGYEMHVGVTTGPGTARPMLDLPGGPDGAVSPDGQVGGCYLHGLFASDSFRAAFLQRLRPGARAHLNYEARIDATLDALADHLETHLDLDAMLQVSVMANSSAAASAAPALR